MSEKKYVVPEGMLKAASDQYHKDDEDGGGSVLKVLEAAVRWLAENPMVPNLQQAQELSTIAEESSVSKAAQVWQSWMFLAPKFEGVPAWMMELENHVAEYGGITRVPLKDTEVPAEKSELKVPEELEQYIWRAEDIDGLNPSLRKLHNTQILRVYTIVQKHVDAFIAQLRSNFG